MYKDIRGTHNHRLEERGSHYNTQCCSPMPFCTCVARSTKKKRYSRWPAQLRAPYLSSSRGKFAHALVDTGCHLFSHSWLLLIIWKWKLCPPFLVLLGLYLSSAKVSLNHLTHNNNKTQRYMQRMKTPEYKTTVGGFKKEKETYLTQMSGRGAQHSDCVHTLRTPLELEFTSAEASRLTPCDWQTETAQSSCRAEELATLNLKFCHNETEIGRPIRWLRRCIKRRRKNFSGDFLAFF